MGMSWAIEVMARVTPSVLEQIPEKEFLAAVVDYALLRDWQVYHTYHSRRSERGFPDLTLARRAEVLFRELKTEKGKLTGEQRQWGLSLGGYWRVWRPSDAAQIIEELR